jgi:hypothetical protein
VGLAERPENIWQPLKVTRGGGVPSPAFPPDFRALNAPQNDFFFPPRYDDPPEKRGDKGQILFSFHVKKNI